MENKPIERCPICNARTILEAGKIVFENDDTPERETVAFLPQYEICKNSDYKDGKPCPNYGLTVNTIMHRME